MADTSPYIANIRAQLVRASWERSFVTLDYLTGVDIRVVDCRNHEAATTLMRAGGRIDADAPPLPDGSQPTLIANDPEFVERAVVFTVGRIGFRIDTYVAGPNAGHRSADLLSRIAFLQHDRAAPGPDALGSVVTTRGLRFRMLAAEIVMLIWLQVVLAARTLMTDRSSWQRVGARLRRRPPTLGHRIVDVDARARELLAVHRRRILVRNATVVAALVTATVLHRGLTHRALLVLVAVGTLATLESRRQSRMVVAPCALRRPASLNWRRLVSIVLLIVGFFVAFAGFILLWTMISAQVVGAPGNRAQLVDAYRRVSLLLGGALILVASVPVTLARRLRMAEVSAVADADPRPATLLLRSFADDALRIRARAVHASFIDRLLIRRWERFEELLARNLGPIGSAIALDERGTRLPPLGAARRPVGQHWQPAVTTHIDAAPLIVVAIGRTESLAWEVAELRARDALSKTVFVLPPVPRKERQARLRALAAMLSVPTVLIDLETHARKALAIVLPDGRSPLVLVAAAQDDVSYEAALAHAHELLTVDRNEALERIEGHDAELSASPPLHGEPLIYAAGSAPRYRPWFRRPSILVWALFAVVSTMGKIATTVAPPRPHKGTFITTTSAGRVLVQDKLSDRIFAVLADGAVVEIDTATATAQPRGTLGLRATDAWVSGDRLIAISTTQELVAGLDLGTGKAWSRHVGGVPRGVAIRGRDAFVSLAGEDRVARLDPTTGREVESIPLTGVPWDIAATESGVVVTLARTHRLAVIDLAAERLVPRLIPVSPGPRTVFVMGSKAWCYSTSLGSVTRVDLESGLDELVDTVEASSPPVTTDPSSVAFGALAEADGVRRLRIYPPDTDEKPADLVLPARPSALLVSGRRMAVVAFLGVKQLAIYSY